MKLFIKNMVCIRCKMVVKQQLRKLNLKYIEINIGEVEIENEITEDRYQKLKLALHKFGLELIDNKKTILVEKVKRAILSLVYYIDEPNRLNASDYLSKALNYDYTYLANLFSQLEGTTIEQYIIHLKIERVKELLLYDELSLKEISYKLNYSSIAHLSNQFKKVTGLTTSKFKTLKNHHLAGLESI